MDAVARGGSSIPTRIWRPPLLLTTTVPLIKTVTGGHFAGDIHDDGVTLPVLHQLFLAQTSVHELFRELVAAKLEELHVWLHAAIKRHGDAPGPREYLGVFNVHFVPNDVGRLQRVALGEMQGIAMEIAGAIEPAAVVEVGDIHDERVSLPMPNRMSHPGIVGRASDLIEMNGARRIGDFVGDVDFIRTLRYLEGEGHIHGARRAGQIALELRIAVNLVL